MASHKWVALTFNKLDRIYEYLKLYKSNSEMTVDNIMQTILVILEEPTENKNA